MIISFRCKATEKIHQGVKSPDLPTDIQKVALLDILPALKGRDSLGLRGWTQAGFGSRV